MKTMRFILVLIVLLTLAGCFGSPVKVGPPGDGHQPPGFGDGVGTIVMRTGERPTEIQMLSASETSPTYARYSVAHPEYDFYLLRDAVVEPSGYSETSSTMPTGTGFDAAVVGYVPHTTSPDSGNIISAASTPEVNVFQDQVTEVDFDILPFEYEFIFNDEVVIGAGDSTVTLKVTSPITLGPNPMVIMGRDPWENDGRNSMILASDPIYGDGVYTTKWTINHPSEPTRIYFQVEFFTDMNRWVDPTADIKFLTVPIPSLTLGDDLPYMDFVND